LVGALPVHGLLLGVEPLAAHAVQAAVLAEVDVPGVVDLLEDGLHHPLVPGLRGADELVEGEAHALPGLAEDAADAIGVGLGRLAGAGRALGDLVAVLVRAGEEEHPLTLHPVTARHGVARHRGVGMPDVGDVVHVVDRRGDVLSMLAGMLSLLPDPYNSLI